MKTPYKNIYTILKLNRLIVLSVVIIAFMSSAFSLWSVYDMNRDMLNSMFAVRSDGTVLPLELSNERENLAVEARSHLEMFHRYFYGLDPGSYENKLEKALWLGDSSVDNVFKQKRMEGLYNQLLQYSLVQKVREVSTELDLDSTPYAFRTRLLFEVHRGKAVDAYELITTGHLLRVDRHFPRNPHGFLITDFFESSLKKLTHENR